MQTARYRYNRLGLLRTLFLIAVNLLMRNLRQLSFILAAVTGLCSFSACLKKQTNPPARASLSQATERYQGETKEHIVRKGETLAKISEHYYGSPQGWKALAVENNLREPNKLPVGLRLKLPPGLLVARNELTAKASPTKLSNSSSSRKEVSAKAGKNISAKTNYKQQKTRAAATKIPPTEIPAIKIEGSNDSWKVEEENKSQPLSRQTTAEEKTISEAASDLKKSESSPEKVKSPARFYTCIGEQCSAANS